MVALHFCDEYIYLYSKHSADFKINAVEEERKDGEDWWTRQWHHGNLFDVTSPPCPCQDWRGNFGELGMHVWLHFRFRKLHHFYIGLKLGLIKKSNKYSILLLYQRVPNVSCLLLKNNTRSWLVLKVRILSLSLPPTCHRGIIAFDFRLK